MNLAHILVLIGILCLIIGCVIAPSPPPKKAEEPVEALFVIENCIFDQTVEGPTKITKPGSIVITAGQVIIDGFEMEGGDGDLSAALRWGIQRLSDPVQTVGFRSFQEAVRSANPGDIIIVTETACRAQESE